MKNRIAENEEPVAKLTDYAGHDGTWPETPNDGPFSEVWSNGKVTDATE